MSRDFVRLRCGSREFQFGTSILVLGVVNVTPDAQQWASYLCRSDLGVAR